MAMSFDDKFIQCIQNLNDVDKPDYPDDETNLYADFVELLTVFFKRRRNCSWGHPRPLLW